MGNGIAHTFAQFGYKVNLIDISEESLEKGLKTISGNLDRMVFKEKISEADKESTLNNITSFTNLEEVAFVDSEELLTIDGVDEVRRRDQVGGRAELGAEVVEHQHPATQAPRAELEPGPKGREAVEADRPGADLVR